MPFSFAGFGAAASNALAGGMQGMAQRAQVEEEQRRARVAEAAAEEERKRRIAQDQFLRQQHADSQAQLAIANGRADASQLREMSGAGFGRVANADGMADMAPLGQQGAMGGAASNMAPVAAYLASVGKQAQQTGGWAKTGYSDSEKREANDLYTAAQGRTERQQDRADRKAENDAERVFSASEGAKNRAAMQQRIDSRPEPMGARIPSNAMNAMVANDVALTRIDDTIKLVGANPGALGPTNRLGGATLKNHLGASEADMSTRAGVADIGSLLIHDRSGAAVTVSEFPRLAPFVPLATDPPALAKAKLTRLRAAIKAENELYKANYSEEQGYRGFVGTEREEVPAVAKPDATAGGFPSFEEWKRKRGGR